MSATPDDAGPARVAPVEQDSRGILDPWLLQQRVRLTRYAALPDLAGIIEHVWTVRWALPEGVEHRQQLLTRPAGNLSVGPADGHDAGGPIEAVVYGVARERSARRLVGHGWTVAALTGVGGLGALTDGRAERVTDGTVPLGDALGIDGPALIRAITATDDDAERAALLQHAVLASPRMADRHRLAAAREVAAVARLAEADRGIRRVGDLAARAGLSTRTLQRLFAEYAGVSPTWVLRRYRLLDAAEAVRDGRPPDWAQLALALGYADQAHLVRDFHAALGRTPAAYARDQEPAG